MNPGILSIIPPIVAILSATFTKRIIPSLVLGLWTGALLLKPDIIGGTIKAVEYVANALASRENAFIILFLFSFGSLAEIISMSGGIKGFGKLAEKYVKTERGALLSVWAVTPATFLDCCFHVVSTGTISTPLMEKVKGSKEKLAFIINVTSSQLIVLIPFATTYVGYIVGVVASSMRKAGLAGSAYGLYLKSIPFNFYSIAIVLISILVIFFGLGFGKIALGKVSAQDAQGGVHGGHEAHKQCEFEEKAPPRIINLIMPLVTLVALIIFFFWWTGRGPGRTFLSAIMNAKFEEAIFIASFGTLIITSVFYVIQKIPLGEIESHFLKGGTELIPPIVVLLLSWSIAGVTEDLGFVKFITGTLGAAIPGYLIPVAVFLIAGATSYFVGSAWGTWALVMPLALPLTVATGGNLALAVGAVLAGGSIGDNISPLGETPVLTSTITDMSILQHVRSELPYGLAAIGISAVLYLGAGIYLS